MHKRNKLFVTIGLVYGLLGGLPMLAGGALIWLSFAIFTWRVWPVLWPRTTEPRVVSSAEFQ